MPDKIHLDFQIPHEYLGQRLDRVLAQLHPEYARTLWQRWLGLGYVFVQNQIVLGKTKIKGGESVRVVAEVHPRLETQPEAIELAIVYQDQALMVLNKPAGMVVHPAAGHASGTLVNALLYACPELEILPRAGLIHRLDKDTSGLLLVAKQLTTYHRLTQSLREREIGRHYLAIVHGLPICGGRVDAPMGRHPRVRQKMAVLQGGKPAVTHFRIQETLQRNTSLLKVTLETGRTHQIRVHLSHKGYPLVGDPLYHRRGQSLVFDEFFFKRQALHAETLTVDHPVSGEKLSFSVRPPDDFLALLERLR